jgi:hypothetical protein
MAMAPGHGSAGSSSLTIRADPERDPDDRQAQEDSNQEAWFHGSDEPTGSYVFRFTLHGTLNGAPVDLTASSKSIQMT